MGVVNMGEENEQHLSAEQIERIQHCIGCKYFAASTKSCDYIFLAGHSRGCPPGEGCIRKTGGAKRNAFCDNRKLKDGGLRIPKPRKRRAGCGGTTVWLLDIDEHNKRMELYNQGLDDGKIAEACGVTGSAISAWRKRNYLSANTKRGGHGFNAQEHERRMALYRKGYSDSQIAAECGIAKSTAAQWRFKHDLPANYDMRGKFVPNEYNQGDKNGKNL